MENFKIVTHLKNFDLQAHRAEKGFFCLHFGGQHVRLETFT